MPEYELAKAVLVMALHDLNNPSYKGDKNEILQFLIEARQQENIWGAMYVKGREDEKPVNPFTQS